MNNGILAARTKEALTAIERETRRLGGDLTIRPVRGDAAHQQLFTLEAVVAALAEIPTPPTSPAPAEEAATPETAVATAAPKGKGKK